MSDYSHDELIACFVSRSVPDNVSTFVGAALPALRAGVLLGHLMHAPSNRMLISMTTTNLYDVGEIGDFAFMTDWRAGRWAEHYRRVEDIFSEMTRIAKLKSFTFPYLYDESQEVAKLYQAICTPDFFLFDRERRLAYRGQFDGGRPGNEIPVTGSDLRAAAEAVLRGNSAPAEQTPSVGCGIKWKAGQEPNWA